MTTTIERHGLPNDIGLYRNFTFTPIDQDCQYDFLRPAIVENFIHCGAYGSSRLQDIIDQDDGSIVDIGWQA